jgi:hypothetical protein
LHFLRIHLRFCGRLQAAKGLLHASTQTFVPAHEDVGENMHPRSPTELVRLGNQGASVVRLKPIAPPGRLAVLAHRAEGKLPPRISRRHPSCGGPSVVTNAVVAPERRANCRAVCSINPFATYALGAPFAHPGNIGDKSVYHLGRRRDCDLGSPSRRTCHRRTIPKKA